MFVRSRRLFLLLVILLFAVGHGHDVLGKFVHHHHCEMPHQSSHSGQQQDDDDDDDDDADHLIEHHCTVAIMPVFQLMPIDELPLTGSIEIPAEIMPETLPGEIEVPPQIG